MDYNKIGLKVGIEIHQQLDTHKLFCKCPSIVRDDKPDFIVTRRLRAVAGETGEIDRAAGFEQARAKEYIYEGYYDTTCLVELDEEPPGPLNEEALLCVLQVSKMLDAKPVDEVQVMRKTVIDGSNTTGFQRTALVARNGLLKTSGGDVRIPTICLEEDACKKVRAEGNKVVYNLSRLGIPLIEIATEPDITTPEHAKEVAETIGMILRSTKKVKRGLGTIRQDINVSIKGGSRIEIKGAQNLKLIPLLIENEIKRQTNLLEIRKILAEKKIKKINTQPVDVSEVFIHSDCGFIKKAMDKGSRVIGIKLPGFKDILGFELMPNYRFGTELKDIAVSFGVKGIIHRDEDLSKYPISNKELEMLINKLELKKDDNFILSVGDAGKIATMFEHLIIPRINYAFIGVPEEVRVAKDDGTTSFLRPMPGAARMYPETDTVPVKINYKNVEIPRLLKDIEAEYKTKYMLSDELAHDLVRSGYDFERFTSNLKNIKPAFIAETLVSLPKTIKRKYNIDVKPTEDQFFEILMYVDNNTISKDALIEVLKELNKRAIPDIIKDYRMISDKELEKELKEIIKKNKDAPKGAIIGIAMKKFKGRADGRKINEIVSKLIT